MSRGPIRVPWVRTSLALTAGGVLAYAALGALQATGYYKPIPRSFQSARRVHEIRGLEPVRSGRIRARVIDLGEARGSGPHSVRYSLSSPASRVEDADIRGFLPGGMKYPFNQGTAYHMRVGRRFAGPMDGLYELKRSLVRWALPSLPAGAGIRSAEATLWVEWLDGKSPLAKPQGATPLHLYAYPTGSPWTEGSGGRRHDNFSPALPGEVTWTDARAAVEPWPSPGALTPSEDPSRPYREAPLAVTTVAGGDRSITLSGGRLAAHVETRARSGGTLDLLLKLDDSEEDRLGTEISLLASDFGDLHDRWIRRPRLDLVVDVPGKDLGHEEAFALEAGTDHDLEPVLHPGRRVLLAVEVEGEPGAVAPALFVRGGIGPPSRDSAWIPLTAPLERRWDWSQVKLRSPGFRIDLGDSVCISLREFWVQPGPRERQVPELVAIAPSGKVHRTQGKATDGIDYRISFVPQEPGLWRYGWAFRPMTQIPLEAHQGEGVFYVRLPGPAEGADLGMLRRWTSDLIRQARASGAEDPSVQVEVNALCRWAALSSRGASDPQRREIDRMVEEVRAALPE
ncbi:MAG TPA: hypothetical protein VFM17_03155 [Candidatus Eisenbacteria bacterium]|nr:hypothetical protein [Candidatus Eisenbacteria bacterium]